MNFITLCDCLSINKDGSYYCRNIDDFKKIYNYIIEYNKENRYKQEIGFEIVASKIIIYNIIDFKNAIIYFLDKKIKYENLKKYKSIKEEKYNEYFEN